MSPPMLALYTFGQFIKAADDPANQGFHDRNDANLAAVDRAHGLIGRSGYEGDPGPQSWGEQVFPRLFTDPYDDQWAPSTLSLWQDMESLWAYTYSGIHAEALTQARDWFQKGNWPPLVMWWTDHRPDWAEAITRYHHLHDKGPGPYAFGFRQPFDHSGAALRLDRAKARAIADLNAGNSP